MGFLSSVGDFFGGVGSGIGDYLSDPMGMGAYREGMAENEAAQRAELDAARQRMAGLGSQYTATGEPKVAQRDLHVSRVMVTNCNGIPKIEIIDGPKGIEIRQAEEGSFLKPTRMLHKEVR